MIRRRLSHLGWLALVPFVGILPLTCGRNMKAAEDNARREVSYVREFEEVFPGAIGFFSYYTGTYGPTTWNSKVGLFGRYVLQMQLGVTLNCCRSHVVEYEEPKFFLDEVLEIDAIDDGRWSIRFGGTQIHFNKDLWRVLHRAKGDLSALGIKAIKDRPLPNFSKALN